MAEATRTQRRDIRWQPLAVFAAAGTLVLTACAGESEKEITQETSSSAASPSPSENSTAAQPGRTMTFDALGAGSSIIRVYHGPENTTGDRETTGTYNDSDVVEVRCKTDGRRIDSDVNVGEEKRSSDSWIRLAFMGGEPQYATAVYVEHPAKLLAQLPEC
jgi:hypothetical protein